MLVAVSPFLEPGERRPEALSPVNYKAMNTHYMAIMQELSKYRPQQRRRHQQQ